MQKEQKLWTSLLNASIEEKEKNCRFLTFLKGDFEKTEVVTILS